MVELAVVYLRRATKELKKLPSAEQLRIVERVAAYAAEPDNPRHAVLALVGEKPTAGYGLAIGRSCSTGLKPVSRLAL